MMPDPQRTPAQLERIINQATGIKIPSELLVEWRKWTLEKRAWFISRLRARIQTRADRPTTPFSSNVVPFEYGTPAAWKIMEEMNRGIGSREWKVKINLTSQGVIYQDRLWFWTFKFGYCSGQWRPSGPRAVLHHRIWEEHTGSRVPAGSVLRFIDGNQNNLIFENLRLEIRNELLRGNQAVALTRKSREMTGLLLKQSKKGNTHDSISTVAALRRRNRK